MNKIRLNGWFLTFAIALALLGYLYIDYQEYKQKYSAASGRYKITVTVETPEGLKTGSAVREIYAKSGGPTMLAEASSGHVDATGEAVVVDLGKRGPRP
ncbi:MAG TPA: hypothetical protein VL625_03765 [Patescibacteria group bacterium]|nr:hypothetical protein [Patescibacteria group bacterium]